MYAPDSIVTQVADPPKQGEPSVTIQARSQDWPVHPPKTDVVWELVSLLRERRRWRDVPTSAERVAKRCRAVLAELGVPDEAVRAMAQAGVLEIDLGREQTAGIQFPWEFVIAESTREHRYAGGARRSLLITRHLKDAASAGVSAPASVLVIESAPGELAEHYSFSSERTCVLTSLDLNSDTIENPDVDQLRAKIKVFQPSVVHFTGVDAVQGAELLHLGPSSGGHGVYLRDGDGLRVVAFAEIAEILTAADRKPVLVSFNVYNSSYLAELLIERGALAAIGFQDVIDDAVAEKFFAAFYAAWRPKWELFDAFDTAWRRLASHARELRGTGISLWGRRSIRDTSAWFTAPAAAPPVAVQPPPSPQRRTRSVRMPAPQPAPPGAARPDVVPPVPELVSIIYSPPARLNYSLLHNNLPLFPEFMMRCAGAGTYPVSVDVALNAGVETARYEASFLLGPTNNAVNLASEDNKDSIRVSLTSQLARSLAESVYTSVVVHVKLNGQTLRQQTHRVELLAIDEWKDDDLNRQWLPSFVFPRDAAVRQIVDAAQRYLVALADDSGAGFDGYQSFDSDGASLDERARGIDFQVQAIWWAIISEFNLAYINPPPTFTDKSQRLRTPSDIVAGKRGTCIDLTLLLAACLEYIDIYPVLFLLKDHAFPGYVRSEESHDIIRDRFQTAAAPGAAPPGPAAAPRRVTAEFGWVLPASRFSDVMKLVQAGHIVPIETVALTQRTGFQAAIEEGLQNLRDRRSFESLFDIRLAREAGVTPLPLWSSRV